MAVAEGHITYKRQSCKSQNYTDGGEALCYRMRICWRCDPHVLVVPFLRGSVVHDAGVAWVDGVDSHAIPDHLCNLFNMQVAWQCVDLSSTWFGFSVFGFYGMNEMTDCSVAVIALYHSC